MAPIAPISGVSQTSAVTGTMPAAGSAGSTGPSFTQMVENAIGQLDSSLTSADQLAMRLAAGEDVDIQQVMVAMETASLGLQTAIQIRNKAVDAYREIMGMQV